MHEVNDYILRVVTDKMKSDRQVSESKYNNDRGRDDWSKNRTDMLYNLFLFLIGTKEHGVNWQISKSYNTRSPDAGYNHTAIITSYWYKKDGNEYPYHSDTTMAFDYAEGMRNKMRILIEPDELSILPPRDFRKDGIPEPRKEAMRAPKINKIIQEYEANSFGRDTPMISGTLIMATGPIDETRKSIEESLGFVQTNKKVYRFPIVREA